MAKKRSAKGRPTAGPMGALKYGSEAHRSLVDKNRREIEARKGRPQTRGMSEKALHSSVGKIKRKGY